MDNDDRGLVARLENGIFNNDPEQVRFHLDDNKHLFLKKRLLGFKKRPYSNDNLARAYMIGKLYLNEFESSLEVLDNLDVDFNDALVKGIVLFNLEKYEESLNSFNSVFKNLVHEEYMKIIHSYLSVSRGEYYLDEIRDLLKESTSKSSLANEIIGTSYINSEYIYEKRCLDNASFYFNKASSLVKKGSDSSIRIESHLDEIGKRRDFLSTIEVGSNTERLHFELPKFRITKLHTKAFKLYSDANVNIGFSPVFRRI